MLVYFSEKYNIVLDKLIKGEGLELLIEEEVFGIDHCQIGEKICEQWRIPESLVSSISAHHLPLPMDWPAPVKDQDLVSVKIANNLSKLLDTGRGNNPYFEIDAFQACRINGLSLRDLNSILKQIPEELSHMSLFYSLDYIPKHDNNNASIEVGVCLKETEESNLISLFLMSLGFQTKVINFIDLEDSKANAIIVDDELPPPLIKRFETELCKILDFRVWKNNNPFCEAGYYHTQSFKTVDFRGIHSGS